MAMTIPQAIKELNEQKAALDRHIAKGATYCDDYAEALGMAIDLMEREIPRAVVDYDTDPKSDIKGYCPKCGEPLWDKNGDRCGACNQAISWRLTECIYNGCEICGRRLLCDDKVCEYYADKVDEIRRIHEEADNG